MKRYFMTEEEFELVIGTKELIVKHLPGVHDQQTHAGGRKKQYADLNDFKEDMGNIVSYETRKQLEQVSESQEMETPTQTELNMLQDYQGDAYNYVNAELRSGKGLTNEEDIDITANLDSLIEKAEPLDMELVAFRGVKDPSFLASLEEGDSFVDPAFSSTSLTHGIALSFAGYEAPPENQGILLQIDLPPGTRGLFPNSALKGKNNPFAGENEFILPRNTKYKLISKQGKVWNVEANTDER